MPVPDWYAKQYWEDVEREEQALADRDLDECVASPPRMDYCDGLELFPSSPLRYEFPDEQASVDDRGEP